MSAGYVPQPTTPVNTGATSIVARAHRTPQLDDILGSFEATFGGYVPPDWTLDAECTRPGVDPEVFFPSHSGRQKEQRAKAVCSSCTVREKCLEDAIEFELGDKGRDQVRPEVHGTRGGMAAKERKALVNKIAAERQAEKRKAVVADYVAGKLRVEEIADKHGVDATSVSRWAKDAGVTMRPTGGYNHRGASQTTKDGKPRRKAS